MSLFGEKPNGQWCFIAIDNALNLSFFVIYLFFAAHLPSCMRTIVAFIWLFFSLSPSCTHAHAHTPGTEKAAADLSAIWSGFEHYGPAFTSDEWVGLGAVNRIIESLDALQMLLAQIWLSPIAISSQEAGLDDQRLVTGLLACVSSEN